MTPCIHRVLSYFCGIIVERFRALKNNPQNFLPVKLSRIRDHVICSNSGIVILENLALPDLRKFPAMPLITAINWIANN